MKPGTGMSLDAGMLSGCGDDVRMQWGSLHCKRKGCCRDTGMLSGYRDAFRMQGQCQDTGMQSGSRDAAGIQRHYRDTGMLSGCSGVSEHPEILSEGTSRALHTAEK